MRNVALFGHMASGKSLIAEGLRDNGFSRIAFADPLKNTSELAYGRIEKGQLYWVTGFDGIQRQVSGREILQNVGQTIKAHDRDFWLKCFLRAAQRYGSIPLVVDDGRFKFERDALRLRDWLIVGVDTPREIRLERYLQKYGRYPTPEEENHASEIEIPDLIKQADILVYGNEPVSYSVATIMNWVTDA